MKKDPPAENRGANTNAGSVVKNSLTDLCGRFQL